MVALAIVVSSGCGGDQARTEGSPPPGGGGRARAENAVSGNGQRFIKVELSRCETKIGGDVRVHGLSCKRAQDLEGTLGDYRLYGNGKGETDLYRSGTPPAAGWTCYARLKRAAIIQHICWRNGQTLLFKFYG